MVTNKMHHFNSVGSKSLEQLTKCCGRFSVTGSLKNRTGRFFPKICYGSNIKYGFEAEVSM